jgi:hypothetical protein
MSVFSRKTRTLHDIHADATEFAAGALSVFQTVAHDLHLAAEIHSGVAEQAQAEADKHAALAASAKEAADKSKRQAETVAKLFA